jgi:hypothetical protein
MWQAKGGKSIGLLPGRETYGPLLLMAITPVFMIVMWHTMKNLNGDVTILIENFREVRRSGRAKASLCGADSGFPLFHTSAASNTCMISSPRPSIPRPGKSSAPTWPWSWPL